MYVFMYACVTCICTIARACVRACVRVSVGACVCVCMSLSNSGIAISEVRTKKSEL